MWVQYHFKADPDYGRRVAAGLGLDIAAVERLAAMSPEDRASATEPGTFSCAGPWGPRPGLLREGRPGVLNLRRSLPFCPWRDYQ